MDSGYNYQQLLPDSNRYEHPSPQVILVKGRSPYINISLPLMQQYYTNVNMKNQDYAYFQVVYSDIPMITQMRALFPQPINLELQIQATAVHTIEYYATGWANLILDLSKVQNMEQIGEQIRQQLLSQTYQSILKVEQLEAESQPDVITERYRNIRTMLLQIDDFYFDTATSKFAFACSPKAQDAYEVAITPNFEVRSSIRDIKFTLTSDALQTITPAQANQLALIFGGTNVSGTSQWSSVFGVETAQRNDGSEASSQYPYYALVKKITLPDELYLRSMLSSVSQLNLYSKYVSQFSQDNYVYIRGAPEASIWNTDGTSTDLVAVLPRNRPFGGQISAQDGYITDKTNSVKTSLNSLRVMRLSLTDKDGNLLQFDEDYVLKFQVSFNI